MKKKGFTLVELLAVIAILAILVIVAMPNVLGMFNQAKANSYITEVQKYMDNAKTEFINKGISIGGKEIIFTSKKDNGYKSVLDNSTAVPAGQIFTLDMDGAPKNYVIWFDRNGNFQRVVIYDDNFCYDSMETGLTATAMDKSSVNVSQLKERADETLPIEARSNSVCTGQAVQLD